jgi:nitrate/nitrite transporter NarK
VICPVGTWLETRRKPTVFLHDQWGTLSDKIGRRAVYLFGAVGMAAVLVAKETRGAALEADDVVAAVPRQAAEVTR